jgi:hypothetical protein
MPPAPSADERRLEVPIRLLPAESEIRRERLADASGVATFDRDPKRGRNPAREDLGCAAVDRRRTTDGERVDRGRCDDGECRRHDDGPGEDKRGRGDDGERDRDARAWRHLGTGTA